MAGKTGACEVVEMTGKDEVEAVLDLDDAMLDKDPRVTRVGWVEATTSSFIVVFADGAFVELDSAIFSCFTRFDGGSDSFSNYKASSRSTIASASSSA